MKTILKISATGAAAIASSATVPAGQHYRLISVTVHFNIVPAAAGSLTATLNAATGAAYDTLLLTASMVGVQNYVWTPDEPIYLRAGDALDVAYANPDGRTYGSQITLEAV